MYNLGTYEYGVPTTPPYTAATTESSRGVPQPRSQDFYTSSYSKRSKPGGVEGLGNKASVPAIDYSLNCHSSQVLDFVDSAARRLHRLCGFSPLRDQSWLSSSTSLFTHCGTKLPAGMNAHHASDGKALKLRLVF